jgi:hypothetical protein
MEFDLAFGHALPRSDADVCIDPNNTLVNGRLCIAGRSAFRIRHRIKP